MKTQLLLRAVILLVLILFLHLIASAQGGSGNLPPLPKPSPKPTTKPKAAATPKPKTEPKSTAAAPHNMVREPANIPPITFDQNAEGNLDPQTSGRISQSSYYDEYALTASSADLFTIQLQTANPTLAVQIFDQNRAGLPILKDPQTGEFRLAPPSSTLPGGKSAVGRYNSWPGMSGWQKRRRNCRSTGKN